MTGLEVCALVMACALAGGCSLGGSSARTGRAAGVSTATGASPQDQGSRGTDASKIAQAQSTHEYPSATPPAETASAAAPSPVDAVRSFATAYINWSADTVAGDMRSLAARSVGQARSAMTLAAAQTARDYELQRGGIANSGTIEAIAPLDGHRDRYVVVTRELTSATNTTLYDGLRPMWHLALATVMQLRPGQWVLSGWQPES